MSEVLNQRVTVHRAGVRSVDVGGANVYQGGQSLKLSTKAAVFKRISLLIGGPSMSIGGLAPPPWLRPCGTLAKGASSAKYINGNQLLKTS